MQQKKLLLLFFGLVSLVFSLNTINTTYAKYATKVTARSNFDVAKWDLIVNNQHIKNNSEKKVTIEPKYIENNNVASGVIAPGSVGYFDLTIDGSNTDVSFTFDISVLASDDSAVSDVKILKYYIDSVDNITNASVGNLISSEINVNDENKLKTVRIYIVWDDETGTMTNEEDSIAGYQAEEKTANIDVKINFKQKIETTI